MKFEILKPGLNTTIQDLGRIQGLAYGIPFSGAMDKQSLRFGNSLLGNSPTEAAIEFCFIGPSILFNGNGSIVITGVDLNPILNEYSKKNAISMVLQKKSIIIGKSDLDITQQILIEFDNKVKKINLK